MGTYLNPGNAGFSEILISEYEKYSSLSFDDVKTAVKFVFYEWSDNSKLTFVEHSFPDWTSTDLWLSFQS